MPIEVLSDEQIVMLRQGRERKDDLDFLSFLGVRQPLK